MLTLDQQRSRSNASKLIFYLSADLIYVVHIKPWCTHGMDFNVDLCGNHCQYCMEAWMGLRMAKKIVSGIRDR